MYKKTQEPTSKMHRSNNQIHANTVSRYTSTYQRRPVSHSDKTQSTETTENSTISRFSTACRKAMWTSNSSDTTQTWEPPFYSSFCSPSPQACIRTNTSLLGLGSSRLSSLDVGVRAFTTKDSTWKLPADTIAAVEVIGFIAVSILS